MTLTMRWAKLFLERLARAEPQSPSPEEQPAERPAPAKQVDVAGALCPRCRHALVRNPHQVRAGRARARSAERDERGRFLPRALNRSVLAIIACAIVLIFFRATFATEIPCRDLETADADELLATVDRQSIKYGGGVRIGEYDCDPCRHLGIAGCDRFPPRQGTGAPTPAPSLPPPKGCDWRTILEDDRMLDPEHRLMYVLSSHLTGSGSWGDLLVFGCTSGQVGTVYLGQFGTQETKTDPGIFDSAPPALRSSLEEYMKHSATRSRDQSGHSSEGSIRP